MTNPAAADAIHTVDDIARRFHVHKQTVRLWIRTGQLGHLRVGRYTYVTDDQLAVFEAARRNDIAG